MIEVLANHFLRSVDQEQITDDRALTDALTKFLIRRNIPFREGGTTFGHFKGEACLWMRDPPDPPPSTVVPEKPVVALKTNGGLLPITMMNIIDGWARDNEPTEKTVYSWRRIMAKLTAHVGHDDVTQIGDTDIVSWKEALLASSLSRKTVSNHLTIATTLFNWAERNKKVATNPAPGISIKIKKKSGIRGFSHDEAKRILVASRSEKEAHKRWVPWLVCFTGGRLEEICGAAASDVRTIRGEHCLHIRLDNRDERAGLKKDEHSERIIPLHRAIIGEGFLDYVKTLPKNAPLFPGITPDRFGRRGGNGSKTIGRWVREKVGITDDRIAPNHSWRHRFKTLCRDTGMREDLEEYLTSHAEGTSGRRYGEYEVEALANAVALIKSPV